MKAKDFFSRQSLMFLLATALMMGITMAACDKTEETEKVDLSELQKLVTTGESYLASASEGNAPGEFIKGALSDLQAGVDQAKQVLNNPPTEQSEIETAITAFEDVLFAFEAKEIKDVALQFGATDSTKAIETSAQSAESFNLSVFTFETWVIYYDKPGFFGQILSTEFYEEGLRGWNLRIGDNDALDFTIADGNESRLQPAEGATVPRNEWTHVACTFDGEYMRSYVNGKMVGELEASDRDSIFVTSTLEGKQPLTFGNSAGFAQPERRLIGKLFDIRFWDIARTQSEIQEDMGYILTGEEDHLVAYWPFMKDNPQTTIPDATSSYNLDLINGTVTSTRE